MRRIGLLLLTVVFVAFSHARAHSCLKDYMVNEKWIRHSMTREDLRVAAVLAKKDGVENGWRYVAGFGDRYAGLAALVTRRDWSTRKFALGKLVHRHWHTIVGPEKDQRFFELVASRHFEQYLRILATGTWPDSNQILLSYLTAVRAFGLPDALVFDAAWLSSSYNAIVDWRAFNLLPFSRWAESGKVCWSLSRDRADEIIATDFGFEPGFQMRREEPFFGSLSDLQTVRAE